jgi:hypothetical protein
MVSACSEELLDDFARSTRDPAGPGRDRGLEPVFHKDAFYGERRYEATDLEGHRWHFGERYADITARGGSVPEDPQSGTS